MKKIVDNDDDDYTLFKVKKCTTDLILQHTDILP